MSTEKKQTSLQPLFGKQNYMWMIVGAIFVVVGFMVMTGGKNADPNTFDTNVVYSKMRITVAPILIIIGLVIEIYAIFKKGK